MRNWLFDMDSPLIKGLSRIFDCLLLAVLTIICSLPVITIGAAMSALYDIMIKMVLDRDQGILKPYFVSFAKNFKRGTLIWLICLLGIAFVGGNYYLLNLEMTGVEEWMRTVIFVLVFVVTLLMAFVLIYVFPLQARYENKVGTTLKNALFISIVQFPRSIGLFLLNGLVVGIGAFAPSVIPLLFIVEFSAVAYFTAFNMVKVFVALGDEDAKKKKTEEDEVIESEEAESNEEAAEEIIEEAKSGEESTEEIIEAAESGEESTEEIIEAAESGEESTEEITEETDKKEDLPEKTE